MTANVQGFLKICVLTELKRQKRTGYELMNQISEAVGNKPSPGSMYPLLKDLKEKKLILSKKDGRKIVYSLSAKGRKNIDTILREKTEMINTHIRLGTLVSSVTGDKSENIELKDDTSLFENIDIVIRLRQSVMKMAKQDNYDKKKLKIRIILKETLQKMKRLENR
jgi:DNA-binding PadR family transcriptional regulator